MTLFIDAETLADLTNYDGLLETIPRWLERDDLADRIPEFIQLAEARFRRVIHTPEREVSLPISLSGTTALPIDFDSARLLFAPTLLTPIIQQVTPSELNSRVRYPAEASVFAIVAGQILVSPTPSVPFTATLVYNASIPPLTIATQTNWLLAAHPDLYLFASLLQAEFFGWNDERLPLIKSAVDEMLGELAEQGMRKRYGTAPLVARPAVSEAARGAYRR